MQLPSKYMKHNGFVSAVTGWNQVKESWPIPARAE